MSSETLVNTSSVRVAADGDLVEMHVWGRLTRPDYEAVVPALSPLVAKFGKLRFLLFLDDFHGWDAGALWEELKFDARHRDVFGPIAILGSSTWQKLVTEASRIYFPSPVQFFDRGEESAARSWIARPRADEG